MLVAPADLNPDPIMLMVMASHMKPIQPHINQPKRDERYSIIIFYDPVWSTNWRLVLNEQSVLSIAIVSA